MSNIRNNYLKVLEVLNSLDINLYSPSRVARKPKIADIEVVALSLTAEFLSIDSENDPFRQITNVEIPNLIERSQFNKGAESCSDFLKQSVWPWPQDLRSLRIISLWTACLWKSVKPRDKTV